MKISREITNRTKITIKGEFITCNYNINFKKLNITLLPSFSINSVNTEMRLFPTTLLH